MSRRVLGVLLVVAVLAACGGGDDDDGADASATTVAEDAAFPVTIEHTYGSTTFDAAPERIVTVGLTDHDALLALGVAPVGVTEWFGGHPHATWPWAQDELGDAEPEVIGETGELSYEKIAALRPDAILAIYAGLTPEEYETLAAIAPTVAQPEAYVDWGVPWQEQTREVGRIVGKADEADAMVDAVEARFEAARAAHPEFAGATGLVATPYEGSIWVYAEEDVRGRFLTSLGFVQPGEVAALTGDDYGADLGFERLDLLDVDALVWIMDSLEDNRETLLAEPLYTRLGVHTAGRDAYVGTYDTVGGATSFVTVLSLPLLLDELVPMLAAAVDGDPVTAVPIPSR